MKFLFFLIAICLVQVKGNPVALLDDPDYTDSLQIREGLDVTWEVYNSNQTIIFDVTCACVGWIGLGINYNGLIVPADIVMGGVENGIPYFKDRYAVEVGKPYIDNSQDFHLLSASEQDGVTKLRFHRLFDTGDQVADIAITDQPGFFVWAVGVSDFINDESIFDTPYHGPTNRGNVSVQILRKQN